MNRSGDSAHPYRSPTPTVNGHDLTPPTRKQTSDQEYCDFFLASEFFYPLLGRARFRGKCWATIWLSHRPEPPGHAVYGEVDGLDIGGQHGRWFVLLRHTHRPQRRPYPTVIWRPVTGGRQHRAHATLPKAFRKGPAICFLEVDKACEDVWSILHNFSKSCGTKAAPGIIQLSRGNEMLII